MASSSSDAAALSRLVDRTRVPDPALQRHAVTAFFRHLLTLPAPLPAAAHDGISSLLASPDAAVAAYVSASLARVAASRADLLAPDHALMFLLAPLFASPSPRLASCLVKAVAALVSRVLRSGPAGSRFPPHNHPFVQALASGADGARAELSWQAARMVVEGVGGVVGTVGFLRPLVMFAVVRKGDAASARDLIGALAAAATAAAKQDAAVPVLKLLGESLLHFGHRDGEEGRLWLNSVECLVDAYDRYCYGILLAIGVPKGYLSAVIIYLYAHDFQQAQKFYNDCSEVQGFLNSEQNRCAVKLLAAYEEGDAEEVKCAAQSSTINHLDHVEIMGADLDSVLGTQQEIESYTYKNFQQILLKIMCSRRRNPYSGIHITPSPQKQEPGDCTYHATVRTMESDFKVHYARRPKGMGLVREFNVRLSHQHLKQMVLQFIASNEGKGFKERDRLDVCLLMAMRYGVVSEADWEAGLVQEAVRYRVADYMELSARQMQSIPRLLDLGKSVLTSFRVTDTYRRSLPHDIYRYVAEEDPSREQSDKGIVTHNSHCVVLISHGLVYKSPQEARTLAELSKPERYYEYLNSYGPGHGVDGCGYIYADSIRRSYVIRVAIV